MKHYLNSIVIFLMSGIWASIYWLGKKNLWLTNIYISSETDKPWVYRQLIPLLARILNSTGLRLDFAVVLLVALCGLGLYLSLRYFMIYLYGKSDFVDFFSLMGCVLGLIVFGFVRSPYDLCTAFLWTALIYLIYKNDYRFFWLFPSAVLNRETSFLLIPVYIICNGFSLMEVTYLVSAFGSIQGLLRLIFWDNSGLAVWIEPTKNLTMFYHDPIHSLVHIVIAGLILVGIFRKIKTKDRKLVMSFLVLYPVFFVMYVVFGQSFEIRVFWEIWSLALILVFPTIKEFTHEISSKIQEMQSYRKNSLPQTTSGAVRHDAGD